jgi:cyclopropane fatty-acyl-phospholipid synthase-like methyltransferase
MELTLDKLPKKVLARIDIQTAFMASRCVVAAERLKLFRKLGDNELTMTEIGRLTGIKGWRRKAFLAVLVGLGLLAQKGDKYRNTALTKKYFIKERSPHWTDVYSGECVQEYLAYTVLEESLTTGRDYKSIMGIKRKYYTDLMKDDKAFADGFTRMLFHYHQPDAKALARTLNLKPYQRVLDVAGGSGVMSMALIKKFPHLKATILDVAPVCRVTKKIIREQGYSGKIKTLVGDMNDDFPSGYDVIMFCDAACISDKLLKRVYKSLPDGGLLVLTDYYSSDNLTDPFIRLLWQLRSENFWLLTKKEAVKILRRSAFKSLHYGPLYKDAYLFTGRK